MSRAERLLELMQSLRLRRRPVAGQALAEELGVSLRTLYRDIEALKAQGARIEGEAGLGYVLKPGFTLPPLMFSLEEVEALALGAGWVEGRADEGLKRAARGALAKIAAVLPPDRAEALDWPTMLAGAGATGEREGASLPLIREALGAERKLRLDYVDKEGRSSMRVVWPVALGFFDHARMLAAWCETREDFRHFRLDRMAAVAVLDERPPKRRRALLIDWRRAEGLDE
jgi:predicted DNA-binding transcriptional regulator YafY